MAPGGGGRVISREHAATVSGELRSVPGVIRVVLARRDGVAFYDDLNLAEREHTAAAVASAVGVGSLICDAAVLGAVEGGAVFGEQSVLVYRPLVEDFVLAVTAHNGVDLGELYRQMRRHARALDQIAAPA